MDWFSRFVLSWELSNTMETGFCLAALEAAFPLWGARDLELRSGLAVHRGGVSGAAEKARRINQHGWAGYRLPLIPPQSWIFAHAESLYLPQFARFAEQKHAPR